VKKLNIKKMPVDGDRFYVGPRRLRLLAKSELITISTEFAYA
jgi:hypothetical protein